MGESAGVQRSPKEAIWMEESAARRAQVQGEVKRLLSHRVKPVKQLRRDKSILQQGSLNDVSSNPCGGASPTSHSTLRRTRSLALTDGDVFSNLDIQGAARQRRSQLIPRARLIEKNFFRERCYRPVEDAERRSSSEASSRTNSRCRELQSIFREEPEDLDSLDPNLQNRTSSNSVACCYSDLGLQLPRYYPPEDNNTEENTSTADSKKLDNSLSDYEPKYYDPDFWRRTPVRVKSADNLLQEAAEEEPFYEKINYEGLLYEEISDLTDANNNTNNTNPNTTATKTSKSGRANNALYSVVRKPKRKHDRSARITLDHFPSEEFFTKQSSGSTSSVIEPRKAGPAGKLISTEPYVPSLLENHYSSLPDITACKNLRKCEKIDRRLRKCHKVADLAQDRFVVNVGPGRRDEEVDFAVKIAKLPVAAAKEESIYEVPRNNRPVMEEYQERLGSMRSFWDRLVHGEERCGEPDGAADEPPAEPCRVVDCHTKVEAVRRMFESSAKPSIVEMRRKKPPAEAGAGYFESSHLTRSSEQKYLRDGQYESLNPSIVEIIEKDPQPQPQSEPEPQPQPQPEEQQQPFDHVRYKVMKSDLFQKNIFAKYSKESQFDGLMQYLHDYSFQELLIDNNIVIIEPIRTKVEFSAAPKKLRNVTKQMVAAAAAAKPPSKLKKHFFYQPIRVNKEMNDAELPHPDTVRQAKQFFERSLKKAPEKAVPASKRVVRYRPLDQKQEDLERDEDTGSEPDFEQNDKSVDEIDDDCIDRQFVSEDVLEKIREKGTSVTYYGGRVLSQRQNSTAEAIMQEIKSAQLLQDEERPYQGVRFRLIKSNSCSSRLELVGTETKKKPAKPQQQLQQQQPLVTVNSQIITGNANNGHHHHHHHVDDEEDFYNELNHIDKAATVDNRQSRWKTFAQNYHKEYEVKTINSSRPADDMEFEPYEVAET